MMTTNHVNRIRNLVAYGATDAEIVSEMGADFSDAPEVLFFLVRAVRTGIV